MRIVQRSQSGIVFLRLMISPQRLDLACVEHSRRSDLLGRQKILRPIAQIAPQPSSSGMAKPCLGRSSRLRGTWR